MKILVVENQQQNNTSLSTALKEAYFEVDALTTEKRVREYITVTPYDLIILNEESRTEKIPAKDLCIKIRKLGNTSPIIILSKNNEVTEKVETLNAGADDYLVKPFSIEELVARVRALLRRPIPLEPNMISVNDITLDLTNTLVTKNNKPISLTRKEFMLLAYLMKNKDRVLSRGMILDHVWDAHTDPFSNTIETHILSLRKKLGDRGKSKIIQTVSGFGYRISPV